MTNKDDPSGFKEDEEWLEKASMGAPITSIRLGEGLSPTRISVEVEQEASEREATASIEIINLCEHDAGDAYDSEARELDYSDLSRGLKLRVDALIDHSARRLAKLRSDDDRVDEDGEEDTDPLRRE